MRPVFWSNEARRDLVSIVEFIAKENPRAAETVGEGIFKSVKDLGDFATGHAGRVADTYEKAVSDLPYTISYAIDTRARPGGTIVILRVIHDARDWRAGAWPE